MMTFGQLCAAVERARFLGVDNDAQVQVFDQWDDGHDPIRFVPVVLNGFTAFQIEIRIGAEMPDGAEQQS